MDYFQDSTRQIWNNALKKSKLEQRDSKTNRRIYHIHGLRKFFYTKIGLEREQTETILGHVGYLDKAYKRRTPEEWKALWDAYLEAMTRISLYLVESQAVSGRVQVLEAQIETMRERFQQVFGMPLEEIEAMINAWKARKLKREIEESYENQLSLDKLFENRGGWMTYDQRVIHQDDLEVYLKKGWLFKAGMNNGSGKVIVEKEGSQK